MSIDLTHWLLSAYHAFNRSFGFMVWNTFLAIIPWAISLWIFRGRGAGVRRISWWIGLIIFVAFLPNAPYVLTDIIHIVRFIREGAPIWTIVFILVPQYFLFMLVGAEAYVLSLVNLGRYLQKQGQRRWVSAAELGLHALCAFGIYLGRFPRFNSWDLLTHPTHLARFIANDIWKPQPLVVMLLTFCAIAILYWPLKHISLAVILYWRSPEYRKSLTTCQPSISHPNRF